jgi:DNA-binding transcriptional ArsR family regulator
LSGHQDRDPALRALADPLRRGLFEALAAAGELPVDALVKGRGVSQPAISQHLKVLRDAGLVIERRDGRRAYYRALPHGLDPLHSWLQQQARAFAAQKSKGARA